MAYRSQITPYMGIITLCIFVSIRASNWKWRYSTQLYHGAKYQTLKNFQCNKESHCKGLGKSSGTHFFLHTFFLISGICKRSTMKQIDIEVIWCKNFILLANTFRSQFHLGISHYDFNRHLYFVA